MPVKPLLGCHMWPREFVVHLSLLASRYPDFELHVRDWELFGGWRSPTAEPGTMRAQIIDYWTEICSLTDAKRMQLLREILWAERRRAQIFREISSAVPEFEGPNNAVDFAFWAKFPEWTADEAVTLALGMDPHKVGWQDVEPHVEHCALAAQFRDCLELVNREQNADNLAEKLAPADFIEWAKGKIDLPQELVDAVRARATGRGLLGEIEVLREKIDLLENENTSLKEQVGIGAGTTERNKDLEIILGVATAKYNYNPDLIKNPTATLMSRDIESAGYFAHADTLNKRLRLAVEVARKR
jgi:hypothetical protein